MFLAAVLGILFIFGYPFLAAMIATGALRRRLDKLESANARLHADLDEMRQKANRAAATGHAASDPVKAAPLPAMPQTAEPEASPAPETRPEPALPSLPPVTPAAAPLFAEPPRLAVPLPDAIPDNPAPALAAAALRAARAAAKPAAMAAPAAPAAPAVLREPPPPRIPAEPPAWLKAAKNWLFTGNLVAKMGLLILFIGVSFLLKYASERVT
ncbi:MAG: hypothetical protein WKG03_08705, partial [Telluria sp.]